LEGGAWSEVDEPGERGAVGRRGRGAGGRGGGAAAGADFGRRFLISLQARLTVLVEAPVEDCDFPSFYFPELVCDAADEM